MTVTAAQVLRVFRNRNECNVIKNHLVGLGKNEKHQQRK
jgi:hypothetical protein